MNSTLLVKIAKCLQVIGMVCLSIPMLVAARGISLVGLVIMLWAISPFALLYNQISFMDRGRLSVLTASCLLVSSILVFGIACYFYLFSFLRPAPMNGLYFMYVPIWQLGLVLVTGTVCLLVDKLSQKPNG